MHKQKLIWKGHWVFVGLSAVWGVTALMGFFTFGWISRLPDLTPAELVVQLSALLFPTGVFYLLGCYIDRNQMAALQMDAIKSYLEELVYPSDMGANHMKELNTDLKEQIKLFKTSFENVSTQTNRVREDLNKWINDLNKIIDHMNRQTKQMADFVGRLDKSAAEAEEKSAIAGQNLAAEADMLMQVSDEAEKRLLLTAQALQTQTEEIKQNVHAVAQSEKNMGAALDKSAAWAHQLSDNAKKIETALADSDKMQGFLTDADKVLLRFQQIGTTLDMRLKSLKNNKGVKEEAVALKPVFGAKEFTEQMQQILDKLQGLSVEMVSVFEIKNEEELWEHYYAGDKAVFMRHINAMLSAPKRQKITEEILKNESFKQNVLSYMTTFEDLTRGMEESPWLGVLVGSDPGRLYMILASLFKGEKNAG